MALIKWNPFLDDWQDLEKAFRDFQVPSEKTFIPAMDVYKKKDKLVVNAPIANFDPKNVDIEIKDNVLTVKGKTEKKSEVDDKNYYRKEIKSGSFQRSVLLPAEVQSDKAKSEYEEGVLKIIIPIAKESQATKVKTTVKKSKAKKVASKKKKQ
ncbi:MAG: Hsp20 family protein [Candidatus Buchananbacteria bacterium]|nr:Hsp20 family protein [Candidatus Buchananbacteria bacterium]